MHRHPRPRALLIILVLALLSGAVSLAGPATALTDTGAPAVDLTNVAPHPDDDEVSRAVAPTMQHLTAPTLLGLAAKAGQPPMAGWACGGAHPPHDEPAAQDLGTRQDRAPPAITDR